LDKLIPGIVIGLKAKSKKLKAEGLPVPLEHIPLIEKVCLM
jgi:hypothetical protein